jgi:hypothetical protein
MINVENKPAFGYPLTQENFIKQIKSSGKYVMTNEQGEKCYTFQNLSFKINSKNEVIGKMLG